MTAHRRLLLADLLPLACAAADPPPADPRVIVSAERDAEWASYRHAYKAAAFFGAFTRKRPLIQAHMQLRPLKPGASLDGLSLRLVGEKTDVTIPVDRLGRAELPMLKQAYEDDAVLRLNRAKGLYYFSGRYSIKERADGQYQAAELRAACEQLLDAQRDSGYRLRLLGKRCLGVKFAYPADQAEPQVQVEDAAHVLHTLPVLDAQPFESGGTGLFKVAIYRFADWPASGKVVAGGQPIAIGTTYE